MKKILKAVGLIGAISFANSLAAVNYCAAKGNSTTFEWIDQVGPYVSGNNQGYLDKTATIFGNLQQGSSTFIQLKAGLNSQGSNSTQKEYWGVWIDFNQNGTFEASERVVNLSTTGTTLTTSANFTTPSYALLGNTRMRVIMSWQAAGTGGVPDPNYNPCGTISFGEVEDYTVNITAGNGGGNNNTVYCNITGTVQNAYITWVGNHTSGNNYGYGNLTGLGSIGTLNAGVASYINGLEAGFTGSLKTVNWAAWIDYNQNNAFEASEKIGTTSTFGVNSGQINFTVPSNAVIGTTRIRVIMSELSLANVSTPCGNVISGEAEDHLITISNTNGGGGNTPSGSYCTASGSTSYEYINAVGSYTTGNNNGYIDKTPNWINNFATNSNFALDLQAGFPSGNATTEYWSIWIDFNRDNTFSSNEQVLNSYQSNTSAAFTVYLPIPSTALIGKTRMRVVMADATYKLNPCGTFNFGEVEDYLVDITQGSGGGNNNNPGTYCSAKGLNTNSEWIDQVGPIFTSGNDNGYGNYTNKTMNAFTGNNNFDISAGFSSTMYTEYWSMWIDFNHNNVFDSNEKIVNDFPTTNGGLYTIQNVYIPTSSILGNTRLRVIMSYSTGTQACGDFSYGEVEDYTINIQANNGGGGTTPTTNYCSISGGGTEYIAQFANRTSTYNGTKYDDVFASSNIAISAGKIHNVDLRAGFMGTTSDMNWGIWIDYNQNNVFESNEKVLSTTTSGTLLGNRQYYVSNSAKNGTTRMRVVMGSSSSILDANYSPCGYIGNGEVEDYKVEISGGTFKTDDPANAPVAKTSVLSVNVNPADNNTLSLSVFPNPANNFIEIGNNFEQGVAFQITNISGQLVSQGQISDSKKIDIEKLDAGIYFIQVKNGEKVHMAKFIKE